MRRVLASLVLVLLVSGLPRPVHAAQEDADGAAAAAVELSRLEADGQFDTLYDRMHADAKKVVPRAAVVGWYKEEFAPLGPGVITVQSVRFEDWTWGVTGQRYGNAAVVAYTQPFANGTVAEDVIRLVKTRGVWRWFFGRDRKFVDEQIARFADTTPVPTPGRQNRSSTGCELVELFPGYPGYRGFVTGLVGPGEYACLDALERQNARFSREEEDRKNQAAARAIGISGSMDEWTWENWMAIEAERGLGPTCYSCLLFSNVQQAPSTAAPSKPNDPRLLLGSVNTSFLAQRYVQEKRINSGLVAQLPTDMELRALVGMMAPGQHLTAPEVLAGTQDLLDSLLES